MKNNFKNFLGKILVNLKLKIINKKNAKNC